MYMTTLQMELALVRYFNPRKHLIVPNVSWGLFWRQEVDLLMLTGSNYAIEIEIKISKGDLLKDVQKYHQHKNDKISRTYFALPTSLIPLMNAVPMHCGILEVEEKAYYGRYRIIEHRKPDVRHEYKFTEQERYKLARLGALRIWALKRKIYKLKKKMDL